MVATIESEKPERSLHFRSAWQTVFSVSHHATVAIDTELKQTSKQTNNSKGIKHRFPNNVPCNKFSNQHR